MPSDATLIFTSAGFICLGILVGIIFLADAWHLPNPGRDGVSIPLRQSPKMRGLVYVISGGIIPTLKDIIANIFDKSNTTPAGFALVIYTLAFSVTVLLGLGFLALYAFLVARVYLYTVQPNASKRRLSVLALPYVTTIIRRGDAAFNEQLDTISHLSKDLISQRDNAVEFLTGVFTALVRNNVNHISGSQAFITFIERYLQAFIQKFLEPSRELRNYRACIYVLNRDKSQLVFLTGVSPSHVRHSREPLNVKSSLAGWTISNPGEAHIYIRGRQQSNDEQVLPFEEDQRSRNSFFKSVIVCAVQSLRETQTNAPVSMVLCIDCSRGADSTFSKYDEKGFIKKLILFLSIIIATAQASMSVSNDDIHNWLEQQASQKTQ